MVVVLQVLTNDFFWRAYSDSYVEPTVNLIMCHFSVTSLFPPNKTLHTKMEGGVLARNWLSECSRHWRDTNDNGRLSRFLSYLHSVVISMIALVQLH